MAGWAHLGAILGVQNRRPVILLTGKLKQQETLQQDLETWLRLTEVGHGSSVLSRLGGVTA